MTEGSQYIVGVDGGGSRCRVAICRADGAMLGAAEGAAANVATSLSDAMGVLCGALDAARRDAGLGAADLAEARAHLGLAGVVNDRIAQQVARALPIRRATVTDDRPTTMAGALAGRDGFVAAIGTGSFLGRQQATAQSYVGGWGLRLGDQASGAWLGKRLLARVLEARDGLCPGSALLTETLAGFGADPGAIALFSVAAQPVDYSSYAPGIVAAARAGDSAGLAILAEGADYIGRALQSLGFQAGDPLCLIGGLGPLYAEFLPSAITANLIRPAGTALDGALRLAAGGGGP